MKFINTSAALITAAACTKAGGSVSTSNNGQKLCTKPKAAAPATGAPRK